MTTRGPKGGNHKRFNTGGPQDKGKQPTPWQNKMPAVTMVGSTTALVKENHSYPMGVPKQVIR